MTRYLISLNDGDMQLPVEDLPAVGEAAHKVMREAIVAGTRIASKINAILNLHEIGKSEKRI